MPNTLNQAALSILKRFETGPGGKTFSPVPYRDPAGFWTIGWGHLIKPGEQFDEPLTEEQADDLLRADVADAVRGVERFVRVPLTDNQFGALVSFTFNVGAGNLQKSTLLRLLNRGAYHAAADQFVRWNRAGGKVYRGLTLRREMERGLFLTPDESL